MDETLRDAAQKGSIDSLYSLIRRDACVLDKVDAIPFIETPLHTAASEGHKHFAMEIMSLKPSFARKLNQDGFSPMHLALQNNQMQMVRLLLDADENLARVRGRDGVTPLHYVAQTGDIHLLAEFLKVCPKSIEDVTIRKETVLHIALKYYRFDAFQLLLGWLQRAWFRNASLWEKKLLNWQDEDGNTVLHIAVSKNQPQIVRSLLNFKPFFHRKVDINAKNSRGLTAFDMLQGDNQPIKDMLCRTRGFSILHLPRVESLADYLKSPVKFDEKIYILFLRQRTRITNDTRNILLVVAALLVTVTFQATVSPPGGVWQDDYSPLIPNSKIQNAPYSQYLPPGRDRNNSTAMRSIPSNNNPPTVIPATGSIPSKNSTATGSIPSKNSTATGSIPSKNSTATGSIPSNNSSTGYWPTSHLAGTTIMDLSLFLILAFLNVISFCVTVFTIFVLLPGGFRSGLFSVPLYILSLSFVASLWITAPITIKGGPGAIYYFLFSPLLIVGLDGIVKLRRRKLVQAFLPEAKVLDPTLT